MCQVWRGQRFLPGLGSQYFEGGTTERNKDGFIWAAQETTGHSKIQDWHLKIRSGEYLL
jgi:hypothetical protein